METPSLEALVERVRSLEKRQDERDAVHQRELARLEREKDEEVADVKKTVEKEVTDLKTKLASLQSRTTQLLIAITTLLIAASAFVVGVTRGGSP